MPFNQAEVEFASSETNVTSSLKEFVPSITPFNRAEVEVEAEWAAKVWIQWAQIQISEGPAITNAISITSPTTIKATPNKAVAVKAGELSTVTGAKISISHTILKG